MSIVGVILATIATQFLGVFWYSEKLFGSAWMRGIGRKPITSDKGVYLSSVVAMLCLSLFFDAKLEPYFGVHGIYNAIRFALALTVPAQLLQIPHAGFEGKKIAAYFVNAGYDAAVLIIICTIVTIL